MGGTLLGVVYGHLCATVVRRECNDAVWAAILISRIHHPGQSRCRRSCGGLRTAGLDDLPSVLTGIPILPRVVRGIKAVPQ